MNITELITIINMLCIKPHNTKEDGEICIEYYTNCVINNKMKFESIELCTKERKRD